MHFPPYAAYCVFKISLIMINIIQTALEPREKKNGRSLRAFAIKFANKTNKSQDPPHTHTHTQYPFRMNNLNKRETNKTKIKTGMKISE